MRKIKKPAVAGRFYPTDKGELQRLIKYVLNKEVTNINYSLAGKNIIGGVVPHAGYFYSAYQAIHFYEIIARHPEHFETIVIINPNHSGHGTGDFNTCEYRAWDTPLGPIKVDLEMHYLLNIEANNRAHDFEHACEVQLPLLLFSLAYEFKILPITMNRQHPDTARELANKIAIASEQLGRKILVIASSDFSHYLSPDEVNRRDQPVIDAFIEQDIDKAYKLMNANQASICGIGPIMTLIQYAQLFLLNPRLHLLSKGHSGEVHPSDKVVSYVSMLMYGEI